MSVALVTGSARGLGRAVAERLATDGDRVHVVWRSSAERVDELVARFGRDRVHRVDFEDRAATAALVARIVELDGGLDRLVHAVGGYASGPTSEVGADQLAHLWRSNVATAQNVFDAARPELRRATNGRAVFFGCAGLDGLRARRTIAAYASAKSALVVLARSWALEEAPFGVTVNLVSPGLVPHDGAHPDTLDVEQHAGLPARRAGRPEEVAEAVAWLVSDGAGYTTGTELLVSGGWLI